MGDLTNTAARMFRTSFRGPEAEKIQKRIVGLLVSGVTEGIMMKVRDKNVKKEVDVSNEDCATRECYWPRPDPGVFTQGQGYRQRSGKQEWLCGNREIHGCPNKYSNLKP